MKTRVLIGLALIAALAGLLWLDHSLAVSSARWCPAGLPVALVVVLLGLAGVAEMAGIAARCSAPLLKVAAGAGVLSVGTSPVWLPPVPEGPVLLLSAVLAAAFLEQMIRGRTENAIGRLGATCLAIAYLGLGSALILALRLRYGVPTLLLFLAGVKGTDIGAYFAGTLAGRHKLIPWLSPGKSWEGLVGGLLAGAGAAWLVRWLTGLEQIAIWQAAAFGAAVGLAGQFADLCESLLKRAADIKDSGEVLPGFGGVLDMVDSPLLASPVAMLLLMLILGY